MKNWYVGNADIFGMFGISVRFGETELHNMDVADINWNGRAGGR